MWLQHLSLKTFRNYKETKIDFNPKLNVFLGRNAQGKTNMLEAILFFSLKHVVIGLEQNKNLIHFDEEQLHLSGLVQKQTGSIPLEIELTQKGV
ncbi:recF/RecN/SMC N terminal domain protein [Streptococcus mitis]|uniref:RecF/RecN/SMC N terminal domain protein n=1 Tax=Streptococcus mitis TaxID=28037 RepID=A0A081QKE8_STRMT|nr:AAA family ATPase [Streptococcus mitis]KEQ43421.1 recF/RecN/SMC N terminal domain protein [Streptococcus mitis]